MLLFIVIDVRPVALREPVSQNSPLSPAEEDDRAVATRFSLPWSGDPLLNDGAAKIGFHLPVFSARHLRLPELGRGSFPFEQTAQTIAS